MKFHNKIKQVLIQALQNPFMIQSDFAREHAHAVAKCASQGFITTQRKDQAVGDYFGRKWFITLPGLMELNNIISKEL